MELDLRTLMLSQGITFSLQAIAFYILSVSIIKYKGIKSWTIGGICMALGFITIFLRSFVKHEEILILINNAFHIGGLIMIFKGSSEFLGIKFKGKFWNLFFVLYMMAITYFTFIDNQINARIIIFSIGSIPLFFINGWLFSKHNIISIRRSSTFLTFLFMSHSAFFTFRLIYHAINVYTGDMFTSNTIQVLTFMLPANLGLLWTFALVIAVNQRLNGEVTTKSEELNIVNNEKDRFFSIIAHDLRGPMATIQSLTDVMADKSYGFTREQLIDLADRVHKTSVSTNGLLENLLEWAGLHRGLKSFNPQKYTFENIIGHSLDSLYEAAENKNITLSTEISNDTVIIADQYMFQTTIRNLIVNAIKFSPNGGNIILSKNTTNEGIDVFQVTDNGIGMNQTIKESLFQLGAKNNRIGTNGEASSGLGLILCKEFIEKHGGKIWVESEEGTGSTFSFTLC